MPSIEELARGAAELNITPGRVTELGDDEEGVINEKKSEEPARPQGHSIEEDFMA